MIGKLIWYHKAFAGLAREQARDHRLLAMSWSLAKYIGDFDLDDVDLDHLKELARIAKYPLDDRGDGERILDRSTNNLEGADFASRAMEWAYLVSQFGPESMVHVVMSYGDDDITVEQAQRHRDLFLKVMRAENFPGLFAMHGDTPYAHTHAGLCLHDVVNDTSGNFGQGLPIDALHVTLAMIEHQDRLTCEPLRRFVADETGVYHTWSGQRIADAEGNLADAKELRAMWAEDRKFTAHNFAPEGREAGSEWTLDRAMKELATKPLKQARSWQEVHAGLARVGIGYEPYVVEGEMTGGRLVAIGYGDGIDDRRRPASICGRAGDFSELMERLGNQPYQEPAEDIWRRPFVMPTYNRREGDDAHDWERELELAEEERRLNADLRADMQRRHTAERAAIDARASGKGRKGKRGNVHRERNEAQQARRKRHDVERDAVDGIGVALRNERPKPGSGKRSNKQPTEAIIWGAPLDHEPAPGRWRQWYVVDESPEGRRFSRSGQLQFTETANFVILHGKSRQTRIDALLLAREKFGIVKVHGTRRQRRELIALAAELGIPLDASQREEGERHLAKLRQNGESGLAGRHRSVKRVQRNLARLRPKIVEERRARDELLRSFGKTRSGFRSIAEMTEQNADDLRAYHAQRFRGVPPNEENALKALEDLGDRLTLPSALDRLSYRDDPRLRAAFPDASQRLLLLPNVVQRVEDMARLQRAKRDWICAAIAQRRIKFEGNDLIDSGPDHAWAAKFWNDQRSDPVFLAQAMRASIRPERWQKHSLELPVLTVTREAVVNERNNDASLAFFANELVRTVGATKQQQMLDAMPTREDASRLLHAGTAFASMRGRLMTWRGRKPKPQRRFGHARGTSLGR